MTDKTHVEARRVFEAHVKPALDRIRNEHGDEAADYFAGSIVYHLRAELGSSVAYYTKADALHYWCLLTGYDLDDLTDEQRSEFDAFWRTWVHDKAWTDALWLDDYTGDSIVELMKWHIKERKEG